MQGFDRFYLIARSETHAVNRDAFEFHNYVTEFSCARVDNQKKNAYWR